MQLKIKTTKLQEMLTRAVKGAGNNKLIPLTGLIAIELKDNTLTLTTTDATNYLYVRENNIDGDDFYAVVQVDMLTKLISKMTCEDISFELQDSYMNIKGNGSYKIDIPLDEDGNSVRYPNPAKSFESDNLIGTVGTPTIKTILGSVKQSLSVTDDYPWYTCYYAGEQVIATDTYKISALAQKLLDEPKLISAEQMNLLDVVIDDEVKIYSEGNIMLYESEHTVIYAVEPQDIDEFAVEPITGLVNKGFPSTCKLAKDALLRLLDRISLFVGAYDNGEIEMTFASDGLHVTSKLATGTETIPYIEVHHAEDYACKINVSMLVSQVKAQMSDVIQVSYGDAKTIKIVDSNLTSLIALLS